MKVEEFYRGLKLNLHIDTCKMRPELRIADSCIVFVTLIHMLST